MTLPSTISAALKRLKGAKCPEDIFKDDITGNYREWAKIVHEDKAKKTEKAIAHEAFILLTKLHDQAKDKEKRGVYGDNKPFVLVTLTTKGASYTLNAHLRSDDLSDIYRGQSDKGVDVIVKVGRDPRNNDLLKNEADILSRFVKELDPKHTAYFPNLLDSFEVPVKSPKIRVRVNIFSLTPNAVSLAEVKEAYPTGIEPPDAAWMWNRMIESLHLLHQFGYVHGSVTPDRFLIVPETHQGILVDFCYAVKADAKLRAFSPAWKAFYPPEVFAKKPLDNSADLFMASHVMSHILANTPPPIAGILKACRLGKAHRTKTAHEVHVDFAKVLRRLYGPKKFRHFSMPAIPATS